MRLDIRAQTVLKTLIERHIEEGQPIGSQALSKFSGLEVSSATIRNILADLEEMGFVTSPHTSAGRVPTPRGYRFFVDQLLSIQPLDESLIEAKLQMGTVQLPQQKIIANAAQILSQLSRFAGVILTPRYESIFQKIEFLRLSERKILLIIVAPSGDVHNRFLITDTDYSSAQLNKAARHINTHYAGLQLREVKMRLQDELHQLRQDISQLMQLAIKTGSQAVEEQADEVVISGERNLLGIHSNSLNMNALRQMFELFEQKSGLMQLLDSSSKAAGIQIYIGGESTLIPMENMSAVTAPYSSRGKVVGTVGVIGPTRMAYEKVVPIVDITARLLSNALSSG